MIATANTAAFTESLILSVRRGVMVGARVVSKDKKYAGLSPKWLKGKSRRCRVLGCSSNQLRDVASPWLPAPAPIHGRRSWSFLHFVRNTSAMPRLSSSLIGSPSQSRCPRLRRQHGAQLSLKEHGGSRGRSIGGSRGGRLSAKGIGMDRIWQDFKYSFRSLCPRRAPDRDRDPVTRSRHRLRDHRSSRPSTCSCSDRLPYPDSHDLQSMYTTNQDRGWMWVSFSVPDFVELPGEEPDDGRGRVAWRGFQPVRGGPSRAGAGPSPELELASRPEDVQPALGRGFTEKRKRSRARDQVAAHQAMACGSVRFGEDPDLLGSDILLDGEPHTIIGVMPSRLLVPCPSSTTDLGASSRITGEEPRNSHYINVLARVNEGFTQAQAADETERIAAQSWPSISPRRIPGTGPES